MKSSVGRYAAWHSREDIPYKAVIIKMYPPDNSIMDQTFEDSVFNKLMESIINDCLDNTGKTIYWRRFPIVEVDYDHEKHSCYAKASARYSFE